MTLLVLEPGLGRLLAEARAASVQLLGLWLREDDCATLRQVAGSLEKASERLLEALPPSIKSGLGRHVHFLHYWLARNDKAGCTSDVIDIAVQDLPSIQSALEVWAANRRDLDVVLQARTEGLLADGRGADAVRAAFVVLSERMRHTKRGIRARDGHELVEELFADGTGRLVPYMKDGHRRALRHTLLGLYSLFRNPSAHGDIHVPPSEAFAVVQIVDRLLAELAVVRKARKRNSGKRAVRPR